LRLRNRVRVFEGMGLELGWIPLGLPGAEILSEFQGPIYYLLFEIVQIIILVWFSSLNPNSFPTPSPSNPCATAAARVPAVARKKKMLVVLLRKC
jgi:hypothetical protein